MVLKARPVETTEIPVHLSDLTVAQAATDEEKTAQPTPSKSQLSELLGDVKTRYPSIFGNSVNIKNSLDGMTLTGSQPISGGGAMGIGGIGSYSGTNTKRGYGDVNLGSGTEKAMTAKDVKAEGLSKDIVGKIIERDLPQVKYAIERTPGMSGTLKVNFIIGPTGKVQSVSMTGDRFPAEFRSKIKSIFMSMQFPRPRGGGTVSVTYPLNIK